MKKKPIRHTKTYHRRMIIIIGIIATVAALVITRIGFFDTSENRSIDFRFKLRGAEKPPAPVVIVAIDEESFRNMPERWTWPRDVYGRVVDNLVKWGAKAIVFDVVYSEPTVRNPEEDLAFANAVKKAGNVVLGMRFVVEQTEKFKKTLVQLPIPELRKNAYDIGLVHHVFDEDTHVRKNYMRLDHGERQYYSLSLKALGAYYRQNAVPLNMDSQVLRWGELTVPLYKGNQFLINYAGPPGTFETVSFHKVYHGKDAGPEVFKDKIVLIGSTAEILHDVFLTPFSEKGNMMPGVEIHANVINTIMTKDFMKQMDNFSAFWLVLAIGLATSFMVFGIRTLAGLGILAAEVLVYFAVSQWFFVEHNYIIRLVDPLFAMVLCYLSISTYKVGVEEKESRKIKDVFSKYVSKNLVEELLKNPDVKLGGEKKEVSILFSDIRGFTSMSEKMGPEEVLEILNEYLTEMTEIVFENGGTLDKFIGDAVMALFGTPLYYKDHAYRAVKTAAMMKEKLAQLNEKWEKEGKNRLKIGIGINSGEVVAGNMGSLKRMEYTVIGDNVNIASRLESLNKELGTEILISEKTYEQVKDFVEAKKHMEIKVKGKENYMDVYEVLSFAEKEKIQKPL
ncbi:MAG TPA: adenylate/guanylate cyclase domain-containing protein [Firmicutes bacterium]|nr:adenylate/guanylate cyclase domain-containing protein [Bacillota bacterium]